MVVYFSQGNEDLLLLQNNYSLAGPFLGLMIFTSTQLSIVLL